MKRIVIPISSQVHGDIKATAARAGLAMAEIARRLLLAWLRGEIELPGEAWSDIVERDFVAKATEPHGFGGYEVTPHEGEGHG